MCRAEIKDSTNTWTAEEILGKMWITAEWEGGTSDKLHRKDWGTQCLFFLVIIIETSLQESHTPDTRSVMATALWGLPNLSVSDSWRLGFVRFYDTQGHRGSVSMNLFITNCYKLLLVKQMYMLHVTAELLTVKQVYTYDHVPVCAPMYLLCEVLPVQEPLACSQE